MPGMNSFPSKTPISPALLVPEPRPRIATTVAAKTGRFRKNDPDVPDENRDEYQHRNSRGHHGAFDALPEFVLALEKAGGSFVNLAHVTRLRSNTKHVGGKLTQHMLVLHECLLGLHSPLEVGLEISNNLLQARR